MSKIAHGTWVIVADGQKALVFRNKGDALYINLELMWQVDQKNPPSHEQGSDRPTRVHQSVGAARSTAASTDWHQAAEDEFANRLAADLYVHAHKGDFAHLVLIAPPKALGIIREALHPEVKQRLIAESAKTLTQHPVIEIERFLATL